MEYRVENEREDRARKDNARQQEMREEESEREIEEHRGISTIQSYWMVLRSQNSNNSNY